MAGRDSADVHLVQPAPSRDEAGYRAYIQMLLRRQTVITRVQERVTSLEAGAIRREIALELDLDAISPAAESHGEGTLTGGAERLVIPLIKFRKDRLLDDRPIVDSGGNAVQVLNRRRAMLIHSRTVQAMVLASLGDWANSTPQRDAVSRRIAHMLAEIPRCSPARANELYLRVFERPDEDLQLRRGPVVDVSDTQVRRVCCAKLYHDTVVRDFIKSLVTHEYLLIEVERAGRSQLSVEVAYDSPHHVRKDTSGAYWIRRAFGQLPYAFRINVPLALECQSYHIRMQGPSNHYVREQSFRVDGPGRGSITDDSGSVVATILVPCRPPDSPSVILGRASRPSSEAHLYASGLPGTYAGVVARFVFAERPPGSLDAAAVIATIQLAVLITVSAVIRVWSHPTGSTDVAALLLLVPGLVSTSVIPGTFTRGAPQGPLRARAALIGTSLISLASAIWMMAVEEALAGRHATWSFWWADVAGVLLVAAQVAMVVAAVVGCVRCRREFDRVRDRFELRNEASLDESAPAGVDVYTPEDYDHLVKNRTLIP